MSSYDRHSSQSLSAAGATVKMEVDSGVNHLGVDHDGEDEYEEIEEEVEVEEEIEVEEEVDEEEEVDDEEEVDEEEDPEEEDPEKEDPEEENPEEHAEELEENPKVEDGEETKRGGMVEEELLGDAEGEEEEEEEEEEENGGEELAVEVEEEAEKEVERTEETEVGSNKRLTHPCEPISSVTITCQVSAKPVMLTCTNELDGINAGHKISGQHNQSTGTAQGGTVADYRSSSAKKHMIKSHDLQANTHDKGDVHAKPVLAEDGICNVGGKEDSIFAGSYAGLDTKDCKASCLQEVFSSFPQIDEAHKDANILSESAAKVKDVDMEIDDVANEVASKYGDMDKKDNISSGCSPHLIRARSLSPGPELNASNKRPAIVCSFFAKGWCIRASSCRFLHERDQDSDVNIGQKFGTRMGDSRATVDRSNSSPSPNNDSGFRSSAEDAGGSSRENMMSYHHNITNCGPRVGLDDKSFSYDSSRGIRVSSSSYSGKNQLYHRSQGETSVRSLQYKAIDQCSPHLSYQMPQYPVSEWRIHSSSYSFFKGDSLDGYSAFTKEINSAASGCPSVCNYSSFSGLDMETPKLGSTFKISRFSSGYQPKFTPYNWEPSVPFKPSISLSSLSASCPEIQYGLICDGIEQHNENAFIGERSFLQGTSHTHSAEKDVGEVLKFSEHITQNHYHGQGKDGSTVQAETIATSTNDSQSKAVALREENTFDVTFTGCTLPNHNQTGSDNDFGNESDEARHKNESRVDRSWLISAIDADTLEFDEYMSKETKAMKHFRAALVEFIKEQMKSIWQEGHLTKDAYKLIVHKAEEKIASSLQPNQIPNTAEQIKQYLSFSHYKILKLITGYAGKYKKK